MDKKEDYYIGLDLGTNSVGWAVTDKEYNIVRKKGKDLWGIREFEEAKVDRKRAFHRLARRRRQREKVRIQLLKSFFSESINQIDKDFFARLDDSKFYFEDKVTISHNALFDDSDFDDKDYFKKYSTIYHLRKDLIDNKDEHDVRLVYLAVLSMFKHRGHFWSSNICSDFRERTYGELLNDFSDTVERVLGIQLIFNENEIEHIFLTQIKQKRKKQLRL